MSSDKKTAEWTVVERTAPSLMLDEFPNVLGPLGTKVINPTQLKVLQDLKFDGSDDGVLAVLHAPLAGRYQYRL